MPVTPIFPIYEKYQAKVIDFHGWQLPLQFIGIIKEHLTVRSHVGLFDVSHMGEIIVKGPEALPFLNYVLTNEFSTLKPERIRYSPLCDDNGGTLDDILIYCYEPTHFMLVVNASNISSDYLWLQNPASGFRVSLENVSEQTAQLAVQGPQALPLLQQLTDAPIQQLKYYQFIPQIMLAGKFPVLLSRTGYTGEDGFEIYLRPQDAIAVWELLMEHGTAWGILPVGLGARDTLRFEACLPLYGNELSKEISPLEAGLERFVHFEKTNFVGKSALLAQRLGGIPRTLIGLETTGRGIPRSDYPIFDQSQNVGYVTSGNFCPSLSKSMALALIKTGYGIPETELDIEIRGKQTAAKIVNLPFFQRRKEGFLSK
ncbi:MAG TPA: glycine cleavage system aminomethyltransferase GcvT [Firmicutes bacterium]|jgi:aminomethyltransferase|nr:glycine cleavage system aminomethyltransferase GcvT [Bacillota bacterium]